MSLFSLRTRRPPDPLHVAPRYRAHRSAAQTIAVALLAVAVTAPLAACRVPPTPSTALVIDEIVVFTARDGEPPRSVCVVSIDGITNRQIAKRIELRWSADQHWVSVGRMRLQPMALGDTVNVYMSPGCKAEDFVQKGGNSFVAGTGFTRLRRNSFDYVVSYHME